jgi:hypothetical protein
MKRSISDDGEAKQWRFSQKMTAAATQIAEKKVWAHRS